MKKLLFLGLVSVAMSLSGGCLATPAYTPQERDAQISRNADYDGKQGVDDLDSLLLLRPADHLTVWNLR